MAVRSRPAAVPAAAPATLGAVDEEMRRIADECYDHACRLLTEHRPELDALATALLEREALEEDEAHRVAGIPRIPRPKV